MQKPSNLDSKLLIEFLMFQPRYITTSLASEEDDGL